MSEQFLPIRVWWSAASQSDQEAVLLHLQLSPGYAGMPWAFLPDNVQQLLNQRVRIHPQGIDPPETSD